jgi:RNA polymerase sigma-70 factor (ECF subfamily)
MTDHALARDQELIAASVCMSDEIAIDAQFTRLYDVAFPRVYSFVRSQVSTTEAAEEVVSRIFLKAYRHRARLPLGDAGLVWVFRIAHTALIDHWRTDSRRQAVTVSVDELADAPDPVEGPEAILATKESVVLLLRAVSTLAEEDRMLIALKFAGQRTNREIASVLDLSEGAVSMRLLRTLRRLRDRLEEMGLR